MKRNKIEKLFLPYIYVIIATLYSWNIEIKKEKKIFHFNIINESICDMDYNI